MHGSPRPYACGWYYFRLVPRCRLRRSCPGSSASRGTRCAARLGSWPTRGSSARTPARAGACPGVLPRRWVHTQGVAAQARAVGPVLGWDTDLIEVAAWLHDIGYAPALAVIGFHPLDGARYLRDRTDAAPAVCALVAHHSGAVVEAAE